MLLLHCIKMNAGTDLELVCRHGRLSKAWPCYFQRHPECLLPAPHFLPGHNGRLCSCLIGLHINACVLSCFSCLSTSLSPTEHRLSSSSECIFVQADFCMLPAVECKYGAHMCTHFMLWQQLLHIAWLSVKNCKTNVPQSCLAYNLLHL